MKLKTIEDIPSDWKVLNVRKKTTVRMRLSEGVERFKVPWCDDELISDPELDIIIMQDDGSEYPCKTDIFRETYASSGDGGRGLSVRWVKKAQFRIVEIPEGVEVEVESLEGTVGEVKYPDYVAIGVKGELYVNTKEFVDNNLEIL